jgi:hypothetical protein
VDELIRTWLRDRRKVQQQREKKVKDQLRADRNFLKQLQIASGKKEDDGKGRKQDAEDKSDSPHPKDKLTPRSVAASLGLDPKNARIHLKDSEQEVRSKKKLNDFFYLELRCLSLCNATFQLIYVLQIDNMDRKLKSLMKQQQRIETTRFHSQAAGGQHSKSRSPSPPPASSSSASRAQNKH